MLDAAAPAPEPVSPTDSLRGRAVLAALASPGMLTVPPAATSHPRERSAGAGAVGPSLRRQLRETRANESLRRRTSQSPGRRRDNLVRLYVSVVRRFVTVRDSADDTDRCGGSSHRVSRQSESDGT